MKVCPSCGRENPDDARFCSGCATALGELPAPREERKVVTVLFADLVGFTARSEQLDPEDVRAILSRYHERLRGDLERHGGTVEKFIGDAVMALFGAPVAHEDDPERAVRAALAIRDWARDEPDLQVRIGVTTGEALVSLGARPSEGEGMAAGDVVNTAARLQAAAPPNGVLVDETTYRATERALEHRESAPVVAKGKEEPLRVWEAVQARARFGIDVQQRPRTPLVGRSEELDALQDALGRAGRDRSPQLVTLVGVPGIGKSRLVFELFNWVQAQPDLITWRQGRSLPYGDGVTFWALGEMVKAQAGVLETDAEADAGAKLEETVRRIVTDAGDAEWISGHLRPLLGLESDEASPDLTERFAAWRRFLELLADERPLVLVFEDLHWADDQLIDFVDQLVDWASGVPLLVVVIARPELLARRPSWGGGKPNATTLSLAPLSDDETRRLVHQLLDRSVLAAEVQSKLLDRAGGNPLYAEEFIRMVAERGLGDAALPETVQGVIAARLDALEGGEKALLQAASVLGKVFWLGAIASIAGVDRRQAEETLHVLERKEFVRRERRSSVGRETEYVFGHVLVRDVSYSQIARAQRAEKHRLAAEWVESLGRPEDHAELIAHHYVSALEFARLAGQETDELVGRTRAALFDAADRTLALNAFAAAARWYERALDLSDIASVDAQLLLRAGRAYVWDRSQGDDLVARARDDALAHGDRGTAAEAELLLADLAFNRGDRPTAQRLIDNALSLVDDLGPSRPKAAVLAQAARFHMLGGENEAAIARAREALEIIDALGLEDLRPGALNPLGVARTRLGDRGGLQDLERCVELATRSNAIVDLGRAYNNLATCLDDVDGMREGRRAIEAGLRALEQLGDRVVSDWMRANLVGYQFEAGDWDDAFQGADQYLAAYEAGSGAGGLSGFVRAVRAWMLASRGEVDDAAQEFARANAEMEAIGDPQNLAVISGHRAELHLARGDRAAARAAAAEMIQRLPEAEPGILAVFTPLLIDLGFGDEILRLLEGRSSHRLMRAAVVVATGRLDEGARLYAQSGSPRLEAETRLLAARQLLEDGRRPEADVQLQNALAFYRSVGATRKVREAESLLAASA